MRRTYRSRSHELPLGVGGSSAAYPPAFLTIAAALLGQAAVAWWFTSRIEAIRRWRWDWLHSSMARAEDSSTA